MFVLYLLVFLLSSFCLAFSSKWLINSLSKIAKILGWKEFVVAFIFLAFSVSLPNFFVGLISAFNKIPQLSLGDVVGGNIFDLSVVIALAAFFSKKGLSAPSRTVQQSNLFLIGITLLFFFLISDHFLSRSDGLLLLFSFFVYIFWLFQKKERFKKVYDGLDVKFTPKAFLENFASFLVSVFVLLVSAKGVVLAASFFSENLRLPLSFIGIFIVGIGNCLPETFFSLESAKRGEDWLILGDLIGGVIITMTLVLGLVSLISPIKITELSLILSARIFLLLITVFFFFFLRSDKKISRPEGLFLIFLYLLFLFVEILITRW
jgi:cation:H+ antiporter